MHYVCESGERRKEKNLTFIKKERKTKKNRWKNRNKREAASCNQWMSINGAPNWNEAQIASALKYRTNIKINESHKIETI